MSLSIGIVGLPNVGKSTLFNALLKRQVALSANYPFATIEPNIGVVEVPDPRITQIANIVRKEYAKAGTTPEQNLNIPEKTTYAVVKFYDIAGLVKDAHKGEGLGNKFLAHIREVDAIIHVIRDFKDENVIKAGAISPKEDQETIETELLLADLEMLEKKLMGAKKDKAEAALLEKIKQKLERAERINFEEFNQDEATYVFQLNLLSAKPVIYALNVDEGDLISAAPESHYVRICAKIESELSSLSEDDAKEYLSQLGLKESALDRLIRESYRLLNLQSYFTAGVKEVRAWTIKKGDKAPQAAGKIHTDFEKGFIRAELVSFDDYIKSGGWKGAREAGSLRLEGKEYIMHDGDVVEFRFNV